LLACPADDDDDDGADDGSSDDGSSGDEAPAESLEIEGDWIDNFMGTHSITATTWSQTFGADTFVYTFAVFDNTTDTLVAEADTDATWSKFQWTAATGGEFYYCQVAFGEATQADAQAVADADATDPANGGCSMFAWTLLTPAM
jgi:hypothetical protein